MPTRMSGRPMPAQLQLPRDAPEDTACVQRAAPEPMVPLAPHGQLMAPSAASPMPLPRTALPPPAPAMMPPQPPSTVAPAQAALAPPPPPQIQSQQQPPPQKQQPPLQQQVPPQQPPPPPPPPPPQQQQPPPPPPPTPPLITDETELSEAAATAAQVMRVDLGTELECFERANEALRKGERVLDYLAAASAHAPASAAVLWRELLAGAPGHSVSGGALVPRTPDPSSSRAMAAAAAAAGSTAELAVAAEALRGLLRLSICDDNDLRLARSVVDESRRFFDSLSLAASERGVQPSELWRALELWSS